MTAPFAPSRALRLRSGQAPPARAGGPDRRSHAFTLRRTRKLHPAGFPAGTAPHARAFVAGRPEAAINPATEREISVSVRLGRTTVTPSRSGRCSVSSSSSCIPPPKTVRQRRNVSARAPSRVKLSRYKQAKLNSQNLLNITIQPPSVNRKCKVESSNESGAAGWDVAIPEINHGGHRGTQRNAALPKISPASTLSSFPRPCKRDRPT